MSSSGDEQGTLYLIPTTLGKTPENNTIPEYVLNIIRSLDLLMVEQIKTAQRFLQWVDDTVPVYEIDFYPLDKNTSAEEKHEFLQPVKQGRNAGILSEAGCPVVADPGASIIEMAHRAGIKVVPLVGPSSILLALIGSGFDGQQFTFNGYLPVDKQPRNSAIRQLENRSRKEKSTQIFMETPYRNDEITEAVLSVCNPGTKFCRATNLTLPDERIETKSVEEWRSDSIRSINKEPTIFLIFAR